MLACGSPGGLRLLVVTQAMDRRDPILGFFHRWIEEFAGQCNHVTVIAQRVGEHALPANVRVHSLGKERGRSRMFQIWRFWQLIRSLGAEYDAVFVHMTPVWVLLGAPLWVFRSKPVFLWYAAKGGGVSLRIAALLVRNFFTSTSDGIPLRSSRTIVTGQGIDTVRFSPGGERDPHLLITVGRVTAAKRFDHILDCLASLPSAYRLRVVGGPRTAADHGTLQSLVARARSLGIADRLHIEACTQEELVPLLRRAYLFLHASETTLDKAVLEAMACGCPVVSCGGVAKQVLPESCRAVPENFSLRVRQILALHSAERNTLEKQVRLTVERDHNLRQLVAKLVGAMSL